ncbi:N-(5'-phosphoribosyl)anthranilate isomerase [Moraxella caviae]|uniref:N-(5'-phosphoribosyl)anthranilate isomerase n=1 Tax=Moraxella caviae TaxID=34060 RepID=A0A1S9ZUQ3_9GAMM|nr:phosphoribosylanthranilate isomerase [Moraxella caviae]OOR87218.1 N-(5'-phosphoribosyl)anthranilate isomerase [Moraxella caviae]STZ09919.1 N-(5'-phosphoribosyl)anthranilate isomerase [Moraxella caviae]
MAKVKFCGLTRIEDVRLAGELGADAMGLVFYDKSPRAVSIDVAKQLAAAAPAYMTVVALVVNMAQDVLENLASEVAFDVVQFHGDETADECRAMAQAVGKRWYKALRVQPSDTTESLLAKIDELKNAGAAAVLLDAYHPDKFGGTGEQFDWQKIPKNSPLPIILAGGLTSDNVAAAIAQTSVYAVDVSGGIELAKGVKCAQKMADFMKECEKEASKV